MLYLRSINIYYLIYTGIQYTSSRVTWYHFCRAFARCGRRRPDVSCLPVSRRELQVMGPLQGGIYARQKQPQTALRAVGRYPSRLDRQRRVGGQPRHSFGKRAFQNLWAQQHDGALGHYLAGQGRAALPRAGQGYLCIPAQDRHTLAGLHGRSRTAGADGVRDPHQARQKRDHSCHCARRRHAGHPAPCAGPHPRDGGATENWKIKKL